MKTKVIARTSGIAQATTKAGPEAKADEADDQHDPDRLEQRFREAADGLLDDSGLVGDEVHPHADGKLRDDLRHAAFKRLAKLQNVAIGLHTDGKPDGRAGR